MTKFQILNNIKIPNSKFKKFAIWCLMVGIYLVLGVWSLVIPARAQTLSLSLYPPLLEVMIQPGKSITQVYKLTNSGETDLALTSKIVPFEPADEFGNIKINNQQSTIPKESRTASINNQQFLSWFSFQNADLDLGQKFILKSGKEQEIVLKLKVPENAAEDDHYATLLFETIPGVFIGGQSGAQAQAKIGTNILITVSQSGEPLKKAEIVEFSAPKIVDSFDSVPITLRIRNTGRAFFKPIGQITISGILGQKATIGILPENVLVNSIRQIQCQVDDKVTPCQLKSKFLLGSYKARVEFGLDEETADYSQELTFFAFPWKLLLGVLVAIIILFLIKSKLIS